MSNQLRWPDAALAGLGSSMRTFAGPAMLAAHGRITGKPRVAVFVRRRRRTGGRQDTAGDRSHRPACGRRTGCRRRLHRERDCRSAGRGRRRIDGGRRFLCVVARARASSPLRDCLTHSSRSARIFWRWGSPRSAPALTLTLTLTLTPSQRWPARRLTAGPPIRGLSLGPDRWRAILASSVRRACRHGRDDDRSGRRVRAHRC